MEQFNRFINNTGFEDLYNRKNFIGHVTASALTIDVNESKILLIKHKSLSKWLQPGGM